MKTKLKTVCKAVMLAAYCALICAAVLLSFTSVFGMIMNQGEPNPALPDDIQSANRESDIKLLARLISAEARNEPFATKIAVGAVILNRVNHPHFPDSIAAVIYQPGAFASIKNGRFAQPVSESALRAARAAMSNINPVDGALYFYAPLRTADRALRSRPAIANIGGFIFC